MNKKIIILTLASVLLITPPAQASVGKIAAAAGVTLIGGLIAYDLLTDDDASCHASCYVCGERLQHHEIAHWAHRRDYHYSDFCPHGVRCCYEQRPIVVNHVVVKHPKPHKPTIKPKREPSRKAPPAKKGPPKHNKPAKKKPRH